MDSFQRTYAIYDHSTFAAIAELGWSKPEQKDWNAFKQRLSDQFERLNIMGINYRIPDLEALMPSTPLSVKIAIL